MISINKNSTSISLKKSPNKNFFPSDFFPKVISSSTININDHSKKDKQKVNSKSTYINLQNEDDEDRELIELLGGKGKKYIYFEFNINFRLFNSKRCY